MEQVLKLILSKLDTLEQGQNELKADVSVLKADVSGLKNDMDDLKSIVKRIEARQEIIYNQTANLTEYHTETINKLDTLQESVTGLKEANKSILEMYGQHEADIRTMRRKLG